MNRTRLLIGFCTFLASNLIAIPILAIYGVHVCPVLGDHGFLFGCKYNTTFIIASLFGSLLFTALGWHILNLMLKLNKKQYFVYTKYFPLFAFAVYNISFCLAVYKLNDFLLGLDVPHPTLLRMTVAFMIAGIMLATLKYYIIDWLVGQWLREENFSENVSSSTSVALLNSSSLYERTIGELPTWGMLSIVGIYLLSKTAELVEIYELPEDYIASLRSEGAKILGIIVGWYIVILIFRMLKERVFVSAANQHIAKLAEGNSKQFTSAFGAGAWGQIYSALNNASETMAQRARLERGLASYAVESVVKRVIKTDTLETYGELKTVTILMSDLRNFTMMANAMEPKAVVEVLNIYFNDMIEILTRFQFTIDKFIGDGILAYIDPDSCGKNDPNQLAMAAAIQMHSQMVLINKKLSDKGLPQLQMGVALHHGKVVVGSIGSKDRLQHTIIGDAVNVVARLEGLCKVHSCGVVLSSQIYGTLHEAHRSICRDLGSQSVRGITEAVQLYGVTIE